MRIKSTLKERCYINIGIYNVEQCWINVIRFNVDMKNVRKRRHNILIFSFESHNGKQCRNSLKNVTICKKNNKSQVKGKIMFLSFKKII